MYNESSFNILFFVSDQKKKCAMIKNKTLDIKIIFKTSLKHFRFPNRFFYIYIGNAHSILDKKNA